MRRGDFLAFSSTRVVHGEEGGGQGVKKQVEGKRETDLTSPCPPRGEVGKMGYSQEARELGPGREFPALLASGNTEVKMHLEVLRDEE